uniref:Uncharacterized protein n=1 Tax=Anguilla anguilla TaxID=7936 RepID=A0A0E9W389_ANGAN
MAHPYFKLDVFPPTCCL